MLVRVPIREYDEVVSLITRDFGRVDALAKGVKKIKSKLSAHLEPFSYVSFDTVEGKEMSVLTVAQSLESFLGTRSHYIKSLQAEFASHALYRLTRPGNLEYGVFDLFSTWLRTLNTVEYIVDCRYLDWFMLQLMSAIGFEPHYAACVNCGRTEELSFWSFFQGGAVCQSCASDKSSTDSLFRISSQTLVDLSRLHCISPTDLFSAPAFGLGTHSVLTGHLQYQTEAKIGNWGHTYVPTEQLA